LFTKIKPDLGYTFKKVFFPSNVLLRYLKGTFQELKRESR